MIPVARSTAKVMICSGCVRATSLDIEALDLLAVRAGLMGDEYRAEQALGLLAHVVPRLHQLDAARLAAPSGVNLRLDDEQRRAEIARSLDRLLDRKRRMPARHRHAEFPQHRLGLIFVDVHADLYVSRMQRMQTSLRGARKSDCSAPLE